MDGGSFVPGKRRLWFDRQLCYTGNLNLDLAPDGKRFAALALPDTPPGETPKELKIADDAEETRAALDMLHVENRLRQPRQQLPKQSLPLEQRPVAQVVAIQPKQIEA